MKMKFNDTHTENFSPAFAKRLINAKLSYLLELKRIREFGLFREDQWIKDNVDDECAQLSDDIQRLEESLCEPSQPFFKIDLVDAKIN